MDSQEGHNKLELSETVALPGQVLQVHLEADIRVLFPCMGPAYSAQLQYPRDGGAKSDPVCER